MSPATTPSRRELFGHPIGLYTLFFCEFWERFSYYGMRALLVLFMAAAIEEEGLGFTDADAGAVYGIYTGCVYLAALPGGWMADRLLGAQRAVWYGGIVIAFGHFVLAVPSVYAFFLGLLFVVLGTGLLKPNVSAVVGELYAADDPRRDSGFTIFYLGINLGAILGPLVCGWLADDEIGFGWHAGFAAAGVGMVLGLVQYRVMRPLLGGAGQHPSADTATEVGRREARQSWTLVGIVVAVLALFVLLLMAQVVRLDAPFVAQLLTGIIIGVAALYFGWLLAFGRLTDVERDRVIVIIVLFLGAAVFWAGFEQAGSSFNLFAERYTLKELAGIDIPAAFFQSLNPFFIVTLAPLFAMLWVALAKRKLEPATPTKFAMGLIGVGLGFVVMMGAATYVAQAPDGADARVLPTWLTITYLVHTLAELTLSPVGLSATTKLAPRRFVGQMMGIWFLGAALGSVVAGLIAGELSGADRGAMPGLYLRVAVVTCGAGLLLLALSKRVQRLMHGLH